MDSAFWSTRAKCWRSEYGMEGAEQKEVDQGPFDEVRVHLGRQTRKYEKANNYGINRLFGVQWSAPQQALSKRGYPWEGWALSSVGSD